MTYEMKSLRKEDLSLYYYVKDVILCDFLEIEEGVSLAFSEELSSCDGGGGYDSYVYVALTEMIPSPTERGRGWVYLDAVTGANNRCEPFTLVSGTRADGVQIMGTPEQSSRVVVYDSTGSGIISDSNYIIDYIDGRIVTSGTVTPVYVDYYWNYVSVVDEWAVVEASEPPVIVIDIHGTDKTGYQLGPGKKVTRKVDIHIFASNTAERNDLVETIYNGLYLRSWPLFDFPLGGILDYDGTWYGRKYDLNKLTTLFDRGAVSGYVGYLQFENVTSRHINLPLLMTRTRDEVMLSDLNAYRSKVSFDMVSYTQV
jgi:hypothetical protein